jgi:1,4-dihydroxy-2-naphthoate octaprenyltransferase
VRNPVSKSAAWLHAMRLRTLPLAVSGIICGAAVARMDSVFSFIILFLSLLTAMLLQILSNFANDYGDFMKGTDNEKRIGTKRALQSGILTPAEMKTGMYLSGTLAFASGILMLLYALHPGPIFWLFLGTGVAAIWAAVKYTVGRRAYGYSGWGDLFVFIFFGPVAVVGAAWLHTGHLVSAAIWPAITIGLFATAVLHINNIRDMENDRNSGKHNLALKLGLNGSRIYICFILTIAMASSIIYSFKFLNHSIYETVWVFTLTPMLMVLKGVLKQEPSPAYNGLLKGMSLTTLCYALLFSIVHFI